MILNINKNIIYIYLGPLGPTTVYLKDLERRNIAFAHNLYLGQINLANSRPN